MTGSNHSGDAEGKCYNNINSYYLFPVGASASRHSWWIDENGVLKKYAVDMNPSCIASCSRSSTSTFYVDEMTGKTPAWGTHLAPLISTELTLKHRARHHIVDLRAVH